MTTEENHKVQTTDLPVAVIMERYAARCGQWHESQWEAVGVVVTDPDPGGEVTSKRIRSEGEREQFLWTGFILELYKDLTEDYLYNLTSKTPALFIVCREDEDEGLAPFLVTASHDEAHAYLEVDDSLFSAPIPADIRRWLEQYTAENYVPAERKTRKRKNWLEPD